MQNNIRESLFRPELLKRIVIYGLLTLLLGSAQCSFFPLLNICPSTPDLIMGMLLGIILIDSDKSAAVVAVAAASSVRTAPGAAAMVVAMNAAVTDGYPTGWPALQSMWNKTASTATAEDVGSAAAAARSNQKSPLEGGLFHADKLEFCGGSPLTMRYGLL